jgi:hypothetical protein
MGDGAREHGDHARDEPVTAGLRELVDFVTIAAVDVETAARRWAAVSTQAWHAGDTGAIAALYADDATYLALAFRDPDLGLAGVRRYLDTNFAVEREAEC